MCAREIRRQTDGRTLCAPTGAGKAHYIKRGYIMTEKQRESVREALRLLAALSVSGDAVDVMAAAKAHLRGLLEEEKEDG